MMTRSSSRWPDAVDNRDEALREGAVALFLPLILLIPVSGAAIWLVVRWAVRPVDNLRGEIETKDGGNMGPIDASLLPRGRAQLRQHARVLLGRGAAIQKTA